MLVRSGRWIGLVFVTCIVASCAPSAVPGAQKGFGSRFVVSTGGGAQAQVTALTKRYAELHPGASWEIENVGSDAGISLVSSGHSDLGAISRDLSAAERGMVSLEPLGIVGTAVAVNPENPVRALSTAQIRQIFSGAITNWKDIGGQDLAIRVLIREVTAATRQSFDEFVFAGASPTYVPAVATLGSNSEMIASIHSFVGGVGMITLKQTTVEDPKVRLLAIDGVPATMAALNDASYKIRRPLYLVYPKDSSTMKPEVLGFLEFVRSSEGQKILGGF